MTVAVGSAKKDFRMSDFVFAVSGNANNGANDGAFYVNSNNGSSSTNNNRGSQLSYCIIKSAKSESSPHGETHSNPQGIGNNREDSGEQ
jgi:hypothetical protein